MSRVALSMEVERQQTEEILAYTQSQPAFKTAIEDSTFVARDLQKLKHFLLRHYQKNESLYGVILWSMFVFTLTQIYLWRTEM
ncbi:MAG: hypothetical protein A4E53_01785 [Pelotomaculum sp. PtaB.Bin104]|nr:MAG: hypothetical protein A4E53_01785 [Pelotomaculum sp. PtaB.Bin104]